MLIIERLTSLIAPHTCLGCGTEGNLLCAYCLPDAALPLPSRCYMCKTATEDFAVCSRCKPKSRLNHVWIRTSYEGLVKRLIHSYKFERAQAGVEIIAELMAETLPYLAPDTLLMPIPTASSRQRARGYDQSLLIARAISKARKLPYLSGLGRLGQSRQVGSRREDRLNQLNGALYVKHPEIIKQAELLLIDDIVTTGGTLEAAAKALRQTGAKSVSALVFAQKT